MVTTRLLRAASAAALFALASGSARAQPVSREVPAAFKARLEPWLTPLGDVLKARASAPPGDEGAVLLLREVLRWVESDGRVLLAVHQVHEARTADGAQALGRAVLGYQTSRQRIHLALARSVQPDGSERRLTGEAAFLQSPQHEAERAIYSDVGELVLVFPRVQPRTVTESIVVIEDQRALVPGEFSAVLTADSRWPARRIRQTLDLSPAMAERLRVAPVGSPAPQARREAGRGGRWRMTWEWTGLAGSTSEPSAAPSDQAGPAIWLSTLGDWPSFGRWYDGLLQGRRELDPALAAQVDAWTRGKAAPAEVTAALFEKVAREVRYTGLEFGIAAVQPHAASEVWANRYGDCKDKANLLVAMLRHKGVPARLALLNTEHAGRIELAAPAPQQFNHAIVAVPQDGGGWLFCDPTIAFARPGLLAPADADRPALLVGDGAAELVQIPPQEAGALEYALDLALQPDGGLRGWLSVESHGYYATWFAEEFSGLSQALQRERLQELASLFFPSAELIDFEPVAVQSSKDSARLRAYLVVAGAGAEPGGKQSLAFPPARVLRPDLGDRSARRTSYWQWQGTRTLKARFKLPPGAEAKELPRPFSVETPPARVEARWESEPGALSAVLTYRTRQSAVSLESFALLFNALRSLDAWLQKPAEVGPGSSGPPPAPAASSTALDPADFPMMPTGEGQCELAERRFPLESSSALRRDAMQKVLQWFPADRTAVFRARMRLLELDLAASPKDARALARAKELVASGRADVAPSTFSWGESMLATWMAEAGEREEALAIFLRLAGDPNRGERRRAWSAVEAARLQLETAPADAERTLRQTLALAPESAPQQHRLLADALLRQGELEPLSQILSQVAEGEPERAETILSELADLAGELLAAGRREHALALAERLAKAVEPRPALGAVASRAKAVLSRAGAAAIYQEIARSVQRELEARRPAWWEGAAPPEKAETRAQLAKALEERGNAWKAEEQVRARLELLTRFPPDDEHFPRDLWLALFALDARADDEPLFSALARFCSTLPAGDAHRYECEITWAKHEARKGALGAALAAYQRLRGDAAAPWFMRQAASRLTGETYEQRGEPRQALATYLKLGGEAELAPRSYNGLLRGALLALELGQRDSALRLLERLGKAKPEELKEAESPQQIRELVSLAAASRAPRAWTRQEAWWPAWQKLERAAGLEPLPDDALAPVVPDILELGDQLGGALRARDRAGAFAVLRTLAHAARWQPSMGVELAGAVAFLGALAPELARDMRELAIEVLTNFEADDAALARRAQMLLAVHLVDSGRTAKAYELTSAYLEKSPSDDVLGQAMVRLWALAAVAEKRPLEPVVAALVRQLALPAIQERAAAVVVLANVFEHAGRTDDELALLKREEPNAGVRANPGAHRAIQARLKALSADRDRSARFSEAVARWRAAHPLPWFELAAPKALDPAAVERLDETLKAPPEKMLLAERAKLGFLVAESPGQPYARKVKALELALEALDALAQRHSEAEVLYRAFYDEPSFDEELRRTWLFRSLIESAAAGRDMSRMASHPLAKGFTERQALMVEHYREAAAVDRRSAAALEAFGAKLLAGRLDFAQVRELIDAVQRLLELGAVDAARRLSARAGSAALADGAYESAESLQLQLLKQVRGHERAEPLQSRLRQLVLAAAPKDLSPPSELADLRSPQRLDYEDPALALRVRLALLARGGGSPDEGALAAAARELDPSNKLGLAVLAALIQGSADDSDLAEAIAWSMSFADVDDPGQRQEVLTLVERYRDPDRHPLAAAAVERLDLRIAERTGDWEALPSAAAALERRGDAKAKAAAAYARLSRGLAQGDVDPVRRILEKLPPEALLNGWRIPSTLRALRLAGLEEQERIVRERARGEVYRSVVRSWSGPSSADVELALRLAEALGQPELLPAPWIAGLQRTVRNPRVRRSLALFEARHAGDWKRAAAVAGEAIAAAPTLYRSYWWRAEAMMKLGRKREAVAALEVFVRYCHDDVEYPEAVKALARLR